MTEQNNSQQGIRFLVIAAALVIIIGDINQAQSVLVSFLVAVFLAMIGTPPVLWLERKRGSATAYGAEARTLYVGCFSIVDFLGKPARPDRHGSMRAFYYGPEVCTRVQ